MVDTWASVRCRKCKGNEDKEERRGLDDSLCRERNIKRTGERYKACLWKVKRDRDTRGTLQKEKQARES